MSENRIDGLTLHRMATYIFVEACNNSQSGNYIIAIEDVEKTFEAKITKKIYNKICNILWNDFGNSQMLDLNEGNDDYYFDEEKAFDITIGGYYTIYGDTDYEDYENYEDEEDDE